MTGAAVLVMIGRESLPQGAVDDELLLEAGSRMLHDAYPPTAVDYRLIQPQEFTMSRIGHSGFFRPMSENTLWPLVTQWLQRTP